MISPSPSTFATDLSRKQTMTHIGTGLDDFKTLHGGEVTIEEAGLFGLSIFSTKERGGWVMYLRVILLAPVGGD